MKKIWDKLVLNVALCANVLIFAILATVAFYSIGFQDGVNLSNVKNVTENGGQYLGLALTGIILIWVSIMFPFLKLIFRKKFQVMIITIVNLVVLTLAVVMLLAADITYVINIESDTWKVLGVCTLVFIGYAVTIQPQMKLLFAKQSEDEQNHNDHSSELNPTKVA